MVVIKTTRVMFRLTWFLMIMTPQSQLLQQKCIINRAIVFSYDFHHVLDGQSLDLSKDGSTSETGAILHPAINLGDFKQVLGLQKQRWLTNNEKYLLLTCHFKPSSTYQFPLLQCGKQKRSFQHSWVSRYKGLVYSELDKGGYCKYCILFGQCAYSVTALLESLSVVP